MAIGDPGTELVYGESNGGLTFLEKGYALDIATFRNALSRATTRGELKTMASEERYRGTLGARVEGERDRLSGEGRPEDDEEPRIAPPGPRVAFDAEELPGYAGGDWPEFAPGMMGAWVDEHIIDEHGGHVRPMINDDYPVIDLDNEDRVLSPLEERGHACVRDDALMWQAI